MARVGRAIVPSMEDPVMVAYEDKDKNLHAPRTISASAVESSAELGLVPVSQDDNGNLKKLPAKKEPAKSGSKAADKTAGQN